ncbi:M phase phosphoprotein 10-like [Lactuca sativa]|uniref:M phase phosphoprotein 10-like n=1 Tax=Lactuca sativa TaxID=4236 RepID=UPI0022AFB628|nr:M phase phosphoprotein 10-like [Lactuca sativa]
MILLSDMSFSPPISRADDMAGFHIPGDPYFPNQGNAGWIEEEPEQQIEEDPEEDPKEDPEEDPEEESEEEQEEEEEDEEEEEEDDDIVMIENEIEEELEVFNPPYIARVPAHRFGYNGPEPRWVTTIERWSRQQRQRSPYGDQRGYYDLIHGGPADRDLLVMTQRIASMDDHGRTTTNQVRELSTIVESTTARTRDLERDSHYRDQLIQDLLAARSEAREYRERYMVLEERMVAAERRLVELQGASTSSQAPSGKDRRD